EIAAPGFSLSLPAGNLFVAEPNLQLPRTYQWNFAIEHSLGANQTVSATYLGALGRNLLREDTLQPNTLSPPNNNFSNAVFVVRNTATSNYNALQLKFQRRLSQGLQALASYTYSHSIDIASSDTFIYSATPGIFANPNVDRGNSDFDVRHSVTGALTYDIPAPKSSGIERAILEDWSIDGFVMARTAPPVNVVEQSKKSEDGILIQPRPNVVPGQPFYLYGSSYPGGKAFNPAAFTAPPAGTGRPGAQYPARLWSMASRFCRASAIQAHRKGGSPVPRRDVQRIQPSELRSSGQSGRLCAVWPIHADAGQQPGRRRRKWRLQSALSGRRTAFNPACAQAEVLMPRPIRSPSSTVREMSRNKGVAPNCLVTDCALRIGGISFKSTVPGRWPLWRCGPH